MSRRFFGVIAPHPPIIVPEVGGADAHVTQASAAAMRKAKRMLRRFDPDVLVVMSPHAPGISDAFVVETSPRLAGSLAQFRALEVRISARTDEALARAILEDATGAGIPVIDRAEYPALHPGVLDHGYVVPMSFLDPDGARPVVVLSLSWLPLAEHRRFGAVIAQAAHRLDRRAAFVASGDCSHRLTPSAPAGYSPRGAVFDAMLVDTLKHDHLDDLVNTDLSFAEDAGECGLRSFVTLSGFIPGAATRVLAYEGPWGVGYLTAVAGDPALLDELATPESGVRGGMPGDEESPPVALARRAIETYVRTRRVIDPEPAEELLARPAGAFVSLHRDHELRGCIGTIAPTAPSLAQEIVHNAIQAATADPRFPPLSPEELDGLEISVDVLHEPEPCTLADLDPRRFGVIVSADWRRGLLLPDLEGVETAEQQVAIAMRKAGIAPGEHVRLERFEVDRYR